jgi:hypothetical protein
MPARLRNERSSDLQTSLRARETFLASSERAHDTQPTRALRRGLGPFARLAAGLAISHPAVLTSDLVLIWWTNLPIEQTKGVF